VRLQAALTACGPGARSSSPIAALVLDHPEVPRGVLVELVTRSIRGLLHPTD
jgi:hypothetical protein